MIEKIKNQSFARFLVVGGTATLIDFLLYSLFGTFLDISVAKCLSMVCAGVFSFLFHKNWTFRDKDKNSDIQIAAYIICQIINITVNVTVNKLFYEMTEIKLLAFCIATAVAMVVNYLLQKKIVFAVDETVKADNIKAVIFFAALVCLTILPCYKVVYQRLAMVYELPLEEVSPVLLDNGDVLEQEFAVRGDVRSLNLFTEGYGRENEGKLTITILQDGEIKDSIEWAIKDAKDYQYSEIPINTGRLEKGSFQLRIEVQNCNEDTLFAVFAADEDIFETDCAMCNGKSMNGPLAIRYSERNYFDSEMLYSYLMIAAIVAMCAVIAFLLMRCEETAKSSGFLVVSVGALLFFSLALKYPTLTFLAEPWAELGTDFLPTAWQRDIIGGLLQLEGRLYISLFNRLVCLIAVKLFGMGRYTIVVLQLFSAAFVAFCCSYICSIHFRRYAPRFMRVLFSVALVSILAGGENITLIGIVYFGTVFLLLCLLLDFSEISNAKFIFFTVISVIFCLSKMSFCVIVPAAVFYLVFGFRLTDKKKKAYLLIVSAAALLQVFASLWLAGGLHTTAELGGGSGIGVVKTVSLVELINATLYYQIQVFGVSTCISSVSRIREISGGLGIAVNILLILAVIGILVWSVIALLQKNKDKKEIAIQIMSLGILSLAQCFLSVATTTTEVVGVESWKRLQYVLVTRWFQASYAAVLFIILLIVGMVVQQWKLLDKKAVFKKSMCVAVYLAVFAFSIANGRGNNELGYFTSSQLTLSDWNNLYPMLERERYCIPILPDGWVMTNELYYSDYAYADNMISFQEDVQKADVVYLTKYHYMNQLSNRKYYAYLYDDQEQIIDVVEQCTNPEKRVIGFDLYDVSGKVSKIAFKYEDGSDAFIDGMYIVGYV